MINLYIYLETEQKAQEIAIQLMEKNLAAHASIDRDNNSFVKVKNTVSKETVYVLTLQTKALLFEKIVALVRSAGGEQIKMYSLPITQCNDTFAEIIRNSTEKI